MKNLRRVLSWPPGLLAEAKRKAGTDLSTFVVGCALGVMTEAEQARVRELADGLHATVKEQMTRRIGRARVERNRDEAKAAGDIARELDAEIDVVEAGDGVLFASRPIFLRADNIEALSLAAQAAGFLRLDDEQPKGSPLATVRHARSFVAFLRAATAAELEKS